MNQKVNNMDNRNCYPEASIGKLEKQAQVMKEKRAIEEQLMYLHESIMALDDTFYILSSQLEPITNSNDDVRTEGDSPSSASLGSSPVYYSVREAMDSVNRTRARVQNLISKLEV